MLKNIFTILLITQLLALPFVLGDETKVDSPGSNPPNPRPSCEAHKCPPREHCELQQVTCRCPPCFPKPTCIANSIPGCRAVRCAPPKICVLVLEMGTTHPMCVDRLPGSPPC